MNEFKSIGNYRSLCSASPIKWVFATKCIMLYRAWCFYFCALRTQILFHHMMITHFFSLHLIPFDFISDDVAIVVAIETAVADKIYVYTSKRVYVQRNNNNKKLNE